MYKYFVSNFLERLDRIYEKDFLLNKLYEIKRLSEDSLFDNFIANSKYTKSDYGCYNMPLFFPFTVLSFRFHSWNDYIFEKLFFLHSYRFKNCYPQILRTFLLS